MGLRGQHRSVEVEMDIIHLDTLRAALAYARAGSLLS